MLYDDVTQYPKKKVKNYFYEEILPSGVMKRKAYKRMETKES